MQKIAFIDRDGTLIHEPMPSETPKGHIPYQIDSVQKLKILPGVVSGLQMLVKKGYTLIMITNQDQLGSPQFPWPAFLEAQHAFLHDLKTQAIVFSDIRICPHSAQDNCLCRKPRTGLIDAINYHPSQSLMLGDRESDAIFAKNAGIRFIAVVTNQGINHPYFESLI